jgi:hypothetical protein
VDVVAESGLGRVKGTPTLVPHQEAGVDLLKHIFGVIALAENPPPKTGIEELANLMASGVEVDSGSAFRLVDRENRGLDLDLALTGALNCNTPRRAEQVEDVRGMNRGAAGGGVGL